MAPAASFAAACGGGDPSSSDRAERSARTIDACRERDEVSAFDDDIVICNDQTFHEAEGG